MRRERDGGIGIGLVVAVIVVVVPLVSAAPGPVDDVQTVAAPVAGALASPAASAEAVATPSAATADPALVDVIVDDYEPGSVRIPIGGTVRWVNRDGVTHTVSAFDRSFDSGPMHRGGVFAHTFTEPGAYAYGCDLHMEMLGRVIVTRE